jgi:hypothetical protein
MLVYIWVQEHIEKDLILNLHSIMEKVLWEFIKLRNQLLMLLEI